MRKRVFTMTLAFLLFASLLPTAASAAERTVQVSVKPTMDYFIVGGFSEGLARVEKDGKCGFIDEAGNLVIPLEYDSDRYSYFREGLALVYVGGEYLPASQRIRTGGKCGFIDKTGKVVIPLEYDSATHFSEGLAAVAKDGVQYLIDKSGSIVATLDTYYRSSFSELAIWPFSDGLAMVEKEKVDGENRASGRKGFIDKTGEVVIPFEYELVGHAFSDGLVDVGVYDSEKKHNVYGYMDRTGKVVIPFEYSNVSPFSDGLAVVRSKDSYLYGVIDKNGSVVIPLEYDYSGYFSENLLTVKKGEKWGVVDKTGSIIIPLEYDDIGVFSEGLASFAKDGNYGYIDETGKVIISLSGNYERASFAGEALSPFQDGFAIVYSQVRTSDNIMDMATYAKWGVIDKTGKEVIPFEYDYISYFSDGVAVVFKGYANFYHNYFNGEWGIIEIVDRPSSWAENAVNTAIATGLVPQALQSKYAQATTRAEFCSLAVALYENAKGEIADRRTFSDTDDTNVEKAAAIGVVDGVGNNLFDPDANLTREQAATMLARLAESMENLLPKQSPLINNDELISTWAIDAVGQMQASGIMVGVGDNRFAPQDSYTREQSIVTIMRLYGIISSGI